MIFHCMTSSQRKQHKVIKLTKIITKTKLNSHAHNLKVYITSHEFDSLLEVANFGTTGSLKLPILATSSSLKLLSWQLKLSKLAT